MKINILYSKEKEKRRVALLYCKMQLRKCKGRIVDEERMKVRQKKAEMYGINFATVNQAKEAIKKLRKNG